MSLEQFSLVIIPFSIIAGFVAILKAPENCKIIIGLIIKYWKKTPNLNEIRLGLIVDYSWFIGGKGEEGHEILISCIQLSAKGKIDKLIDAYVLSNITHEKISLLCSTKKHGYLPIKIAKENDVDDIIMLQGCFYRPGLDIIEGKYLTEFMNDFSDLSIVVTTEKETIELKRFKRKKIIKHINKVFNVNIT